MKLKNLLRTVLLVFSIASLCMEGMGQPWTYDFGTGTGSFTSSTASTTFLPTPPSGTARVRVGTNPGAIVLENPGLENLGTGSELQITSNTGSASTTKFSVYDYSASKTGYVKFYIAFSGGTNGVYNFTVGDGANFSDNNAIGTAQIFVGIRWTLGSDNAISYQVLNNTTWGITGISNATSLFTQGTSNIYLVETYFNNTTSSTNYERAENSFSLANATWDLWVDGVRVGEGLAKGALGVDVNIDSYAFNHQVSVTDPGTIYLDDIEYSNTLPQPEVTDPTITTSPSSISGFSYLEGSGPSAPETFSLTGLNLDESNVIVTAPTNFEVSESEVGSYSSSITLTSYDGSETDIYVRFVAALSSGSYSGSISITGGGASEVTVALSGTVVEAFEIPYTSGLRTQDDYDIAVAQGFTFQDAVLSIAAGGRIDISPNGYIETPIIDFTEYESLKVRFDLRNFGTGSNRELSVRVYGDALSLTTVETFPINSTSEVTFELLIDLTQDFNVENGKVRFEMTEGTGGIRFRDLLIEEPAPPAITISESSLYDFGKIYVDHQSNVQFYTLSALGLTADLLITPPSDFKISESYNSGFADNLTLTPSNGNISERKIYVRYFPTTTGVRSGNITHTSENADTRNVLVEAEGVGTDFNTYYSTITVTGGEEFMLDLHRLIRGHEPKTYNSIWTHFQTTDKKYNGKVWDIYSDRQDQVPPYEYTFGDDQQGVDPVPEEEGHAYNREHSFPKSWWGGSETDTMFTDLHHIYPSDSWVNSKRSNHPYGVVTSPSWTSQSGGKLGGNTYGVGYSSTAFEPIDEYKGDFARTYFYMATRYFRKINDWNLNSAMLNGTSYPAFEPWVIDMLLEWHENDPVSQKEIDRNNAIEAIQGNRNPFIDNPDWAIAIWLNKEEPTNHITDLSAIEITRTSIKAGWSDAVGEVLPDGYLVMIKKDSGTFPTPVDGTPIPDDTNYADGLLVKNISHTGGANSHTFTGLDADTDHTIRIYPYSNAGVSIDYKTDGEVPQGVFTTLSLPHITTITPVLGVSVDYGTSEVDAKAALPKITTISDSDEETYEVDLVWTITNYEANTSGIYDAIGTFNLPDGVIQSDPETTLEVTATVTVLTQRFIIFSENVGNPSTNTLVNNYTGWQNSSPISFTGDVDVRTSTASSGYEGASGQGNVFITNTVGRYLTISGINSAPYTNISLKLGHYKSATVASNELRIEVSADGSVWNELTYTRATGTGTASWVLIEPEGEIPSVKSLSLRFTQTTSSSQFRIDDIVITGEEDPDYVEPAATPVFSPNGGTFYAPVDVTLSSATEGATIYYSVDSDDGPWTEYTTGINLTLTTTLWAYAQAEGFSDSEVSSAIFTFPTITDVATIADLRAKAIGSEVYRLTGEVLLTFQHDQRNSKYIQDATGAIKIDDNNGNITTTYSIGDAISNVIGTRTVFSGMVQFVPVTNSPEASSSNNYVEPIVLALNEITSEHQAKLVKIKNISFSETGVFEENTSFSIEDPSGSGVLRTPASPTNLDYYSTPIPETPQNITAIVEQFNTAMQIIPRSLNDFVSVYSISFSVVEVESATNGILTAEVNGVELTAGELIEQGEDVSFTAIPNAGYKIKEWKVNGSVFELDEVPFTGPELTLSNIEGNKAISVEFTAILVSSISVNSAENASEVEYGGTLQMSVAVLPEDALDKSITWSVVNGSGEAIINTDGLLTGVALGTVTVKATANDGSAIQGTKEINIVKATPVISIWPVVANAITYGQALADAGLNTVDAVSSTPGIYSYTNPSFTPDAGSANHSVTFTPSDLDNYHIVVTETSEFVEVIVGKKALQVTAFAAGNITYGDAAPSVSINYQGFVLDENEYVLDDTGFVLGTNYIQGNSVGTYSTTLDFGTATDNNYSFSLNTSEFNVIKADPIVLAWPIASIIPYGSKISEAQLSGSEVKGVADETLTGDFTFDSPNVKPSVGTASYSVTFTPNSGNYNSATSTENDFVVVTVEKYSVLSENILITNTTHTFDGTPKSVNVSITYPTNDPVTASEIEWIYITTYQGINETEYELSSTAPTEVGSYEVTISISMDSYQGIKTVQLEINAKVTPSITWPTATNNITYGQSVADAGLSGGAAVEPNDEEIEIVGSFSFNNPSFMPSAGSYQAEVTFTPTNTAAYNTVQGTVTINIIKKTLTIGGTFTANHKPYDGLVAATGDVSGLSLTGVVAGEEDDVALADVVIAFADAGVADAVTVSIASAGISGLASANYSLSLEGAPTAQANITRVALTIGGTFTVNNKVYDGTTDATIAENNLVLLGKIGDDIVNLSNVIVEFATAEIGSGILASIVSADIIGDPSTNYTLSLVGAPTAYADIISPLVNKYTVTFIVSDGVNPIEGASVTIEGYDSLPVTDASGQTLIDLEDETYTFTVVAEGFIDYLGDFVVSGVALDLPVIMIVDMPIEGGFEDFTNSNATASYTSNSFVGNNGITWSYIASRDANNDANQSGINLPALMLRRASDNSSISSEAIQGGIGNFSVKLYTGFTDAGNRQVELFINEVSKGKSTPFDDFLEHIFEVNDINVEGDIVIKIANTTANQVIIDDITWTSYTDNEPPVPVFHPANLVQDVPTSIHPTISFNEQIFISEGVEVVDSNVESLLTLSQGSDVVIFSAAISNNIITIIPANEFENSTQYTLSIEPVQDAVGNRMEGPASATFTTVAAEAPTISLTSEHEGLIYYAGDNVTVNWVSTNLEQVNVEAWFPLTSEWIIMVASVNASDGEATFEIPITASFSNQYKFRVRNTEGHSPVDESDELTIRAVASDLFSVRGYAINEEFRYDGEAVVTFSQTYRNQKFIQDHFAAILIDDPTSVILYGFEAGDGMQGLVAKLTSFEGMLQLLPLDDPGAPSNTGLSIDPVEITLDQFVNNFVEFESQLVSIMDPISFPAADGSLVFANGEVFDFTDGVLVGQLRATFSDVDYISSLVPQSKVYITGILNQRTSIPVGKFISPRFSADIISLSSDATLVELALGGISVIGLDGILVSDSNVDTGAFLVVNDPENFRGIEVITNHGEASFEVFLNGNLLESPTYSTQVLAVGDVVHVIAQAEDGNTLNYKITLVAPPPSTIATLSSFTIGGQDVLSLYGISVGDPEYEVGALLYVNDLPNFTGITIEKSDEKATIAITINGVLVIKDDYSNQTFNFDDVIVAKVVAEDGITTNYYKVTLTSVEIIDAELDVHEFFVFTNWQNDIIEATITWNDATEIHVFQCYDDLAEEWVSLPSIVNENPFWEVVNNDGITATFRIYFDNSPPNSKLFKEGVYLLDDMDRVRLVYDVGLPSYVDVRYWLKTFNLSFDVKNAQGEEIVDLTINLQPEITDEGEVFEISGNVYEVAASFTYVYSVQAEGYETYQGVTSAVKENETVTVVLLELAPTMYSITFSVIEGEGSLNATVNSSPINSGDLIVENSSVLFTATPADGFRLKAWTLNGELVAGHTDDSYTIPSLSGDVTVAVQFEPLPPAYYSVSFGVVEVDGAMNGTLSATVNGNAIAPGDEVVEGSEVVFTASPVDGYRVKAWTLNGAIVANNTSTAYTVPNLSSNIEVKVEFENVTAPTTFPVQYSVVEVDGSPNGSILASVDGQSIESGDLVYEGKTVQFTANPDQYFELDVWSVNDTEYPELTQLVITYDNLDMAIDVKVKFKPKPVTTYEVTYRVIEVEGNANGTLAASLDGNYIAPGDRVKEGGNVLFVADPAEGYQVKEWKLNGAVIADYNELTYTVSNLEYDIEVTVEFEVEHVDPTTYLVNFSVIIGTGGAANGIITATVNGVALNTGDEVEEGSEVLFTAIPADGYRVKLWMLNGDVLTDYIELTYTISNLTENINVIVEFEPITSVEMISLSTIRAYPNPFTNSITLINSEIIKRVIISNLIGQRVLEINLNGENTISTSNLVEGVYLLTFEGYNGQRIVRKMIKR